MNSHPPACMQVHELLEQGRAWVRQPEAANDFSIGPNEMLLVSTRCHRGWMTPVMQHSHYQKLIAANAIDQRERKPAQ